MFPFVNFVDEWRTLQAYEGIEQSVIGSAFPPRPQVAASLPPEFDASQIFLRPPPQAGSELPELILDTVRRARAGNQLLLRRDEEIAEVLELLERQSTRSVTSAVMGFLPYPKVRC